MSSCHQFAKHQPNIREKRSGPRRTKSHLVVRQVEIHFSPTGHRICEWDGREMGASSQLRMPRILCGMNASMRGTSARPALQWSPFSLSSVRQPNSSASSSLASCYQAGMPFGNPQRPHLTGNNLSARTRISHRDACCESANASVSFFGSSERRGVG